MNETYAPGLGPVEGRGLPQSGAAVAGAHGVVSRARSLVVDHLRAFVTVLVLLHHAVLAYNPYAPKPGADFGAAPMLWRAFPVVDTAKWPGIELLVIFNDTFFMFLMFFVGGLFVQRGLLQRGTGGYLRERALRLGVPFVICAGLLAPLAYYPAYLQHGGTPGWSAFLGAYASLSVWPAGPAWFLWVLFTFGAIVTVLHRAFPGFTTALGRSLGRLGERPALLLAAMVVVGGAVYVPVCQAFDAMSWFEWGPFTAQTARVPVYFLYFLVGIGVGAWGLDRGLLARDGLLARRWGLWGGIAPVVFIAFMAFLIALFINLEKGTLGTGLIVATNFAFIVTGAVTALMVIAHFARLAATWNGRFWTSLDRNAYGMYLTHYIFVSWLQYALLDAPLAGAAKAVLVFVGTVALSWATTAALRRIPAVGRVI
jgi:peptidoglycan/LPS O-acetylase OafA/YrhL